MELAVFAAGVNVRRQRVEERLIESMAD